MADVDCDTQQFFFTRCHRFPVEINDFCKISGSRYDFPYSTGNLLESPVGLASMILKDVRERQKETEKIYCNPLLFQ